MLFDRLTGGLRFSKSFSKAFDVRHPLAERMNLSTTLFAITSFAGRMNSKSFFSLNVRFRSDIWDAYRLEKGR